MNTEPRYNDIYYKSTTSQSKILDVVKNNTESLHNLPMPIDWEQLFGNKHPIEIEIGPGKGRFLLEASKQYHDINFVGVERAQKYVEITRTRFEKYMRHFSVDKKTGLFTNVRLVWTDANYFLTKYVPDTSVQTYHVYFPDPWPKARQQKRRIFRNKDFLNALARTLSSDNGKLYVLTDFSEYFDEIQERLGQHKMLKPVLSDPEPYKNITTNFEMKYRSEGREIYRAVYEKV